MSAANKLCFVTALITGCGSQSTHFSDRRFAHGNDDAVGEHLGLTAEVRETAAFLADTVSFVKDYEIQIIQCDPSNPKAAHRLVKTATKAQLAAGDVRIAKQMKNLHVLLSKIKTDTTGTMVELVPDLAGMSLCTAFEAFKINGLQTYTTAPASQISALVQNEKNLAASYDASINQVAIAFDIAVRTQTTLAQVDVTVAEAARSIDSSVQGTNPTSFSIDKASIINKSALTDNTCTFQLTLKCSSAPVVANGKLTSCAGIGLANNPWRLEERSTTPAVVQVQPTGSANPLSLASLTGNDAVVLPFTFACSRGKAGVSTEKKTLALTIWNKLGCDQDSVAANLQCGQQTFVFPINLTYTMP